MPSDYKYDVAFSFLSEDEQLATQLNNLLSDRMTTFIYSERQKEIAGTDGEESFAKIFRGDSRIVVVLDRSEWGERTWTQIEQTAIRNRAYDQGYDFALFIPLEKPHTVPIWLPKTQLWIGLYRWGTNGAASVIEARVQQAGGSARPEALEDQAKRVKRELETDKERKRVLSSEKGVEIANNEVQVIHREIESQIKIINKNTGIGMHADFVGKSAFIQAPKYEQAFYWHNPYSNTIEESHLEVTMWSGSALRPGMFYPFQKPQKIVGKTYRFQLDSMLRPVWKEQQSKDMISSELLVQKDLSLFLETIRRNEL